MKCPDASTAGKDIQAICHGLLHTLNVALSPEAAARLTDKAIALAFRKQRQNASGLLAAQPGAYASGHASVPDMRHALLLGGQLGPAAAGQASLFFAGAAAGSLSVFFLPMLLRHIRTALASSRPPAAVGMPYK